MKAGGVRQAFERDLLVLPLAKMLPLRAVSDVIKRRSTKYRTIAKSVAEVGIVEPLVVYRKPNKRRMYLLLDGHLRREILLDLGETETECLLAMDDEAVTYNRRVNHLAVVQEHFMILRAIERGVSEERIAQALNVKIAYVKHRRRMLKGICPDVVTLVRDQPVNPVTFDLLRKMRPARQIEAGKLMVAASNFSSSYARALLMATDDADRVYASRSRPAVVTAADLALMECELQDVEKKMETVEAAYGRDMLDLVIAARYVAGLLASRRIARYLDDNHPEMAREFRAIVNATLPDTARAPAKRSVAAMQVSDGDPGFEGAPAPN